MRVFKLGALGLTVANCGGSMADEPVKSSDDQGWIAVGEGAPDSETVTEGPQYAISIERSSTGILFQFAPCIGPAHPLDIGSITINEAGQGGRQVCSVAREDGSERRISQWLYGARAGLKVKGCEALVANKEYEVCAFGADDCAHGAGTGCQSFAIKEDGAVEMLRGSCDRN